MLSPQFFPHPQAEHGGERQTGQALHYWQGSSNLLASGRGSTGSVERLTAYGSSAIGHPLASSSRNPGSVLIPGV